MNCSAGATAPQQPRSGGREVVAWALSCLTLCALKALAERRDRPSSSGALMRRPHG